METSVINSSLSPPPLSLSFCVLPKQVQIRWFLKNCWFQKVYSLISFFYFCFFALKKEKNLALTVTIYMKSRTYVLTVLFIIIFLIWFQTVLLLLDVVILVIILFFSPLVLLLLNTIYLLCFQWINYIHISDHKLYYAALLWFIIGTFFC